MTTPLTPWERATAALTVLAIDPAGVKGLWLRSRAGPVRDRVTACLPVARRIHPGIDDAALFGGVDLAATLASGRLVQSRGLLTSATPIILTMAERCSPGLSARLSRWLDTRGPCLVALDEGAEAEESLPSGLTDRLGLFLDLGEMTWAESGDVQINADQVAQSVAHLAEVRLPKTAVQDLTAVALAMGIASMRAPLLALTVARALAAWRGEDVASDTTLRHAAELTLAHRGDLAQAEPERPPEPDQGDPDPNRSQGQQDRLPEDILLEAVRAALPANLLAQLKSAKAARSAKGSGTGSARKGNHRGRPLPSLPGTPGTGKRIDLVATLRAAAPWQTLRRRGGAQLQIRKSDLRLKRFQQTSDRVLIFAVDASGSSAFARLAEAKGAVEHLLAQAYASRNHVALIAFRGQGADLLLPPTRSLVQTKRRLAALPGGGGTPLAAGLRMAHDLALQTRARGMTPTIALLTDGRGNIALDGSANRAAAEADSLRIARAVRIAGLPAIVIDIANRPQPALRLMAEVLDATYLPLPRADAARLSTVLQTALEA